MATLSELKPVTPPTKPASTPSDLRWMASLHDLSREHGFEQLRVEGSLPTELMGTLYRVGPSLYGKQYGHLFDGDGGVSAVRFEHGSAFGAVKLVQTDGLVNERRAGHPLYGSYGTRPPGLNRYWPPSVNSRLKNPANTSIMLWNGRIFATYEGGLPTEIAPTDLSTIGEQDFGVVGRTFSAHPHAVPMRRALYNFGIRYDRKTVIDIYEFKDSGSVRKLAEVPLPHTTFIHDFIATEKHFVFFSPPLRFNPLRLLFAGAPLSDVLRWRPELGTDVIIVPIDDPTRVVRFTIDPFFQWHFLNGYERGGDIVVDVARYPSFDTNRGFGDLIHQQVTPYVGAELWRFTLNPAARRATSESRWAHSCEFPRVAPSVESTKHTVAWLASAGRDELVDRLPDTLAKVEVETGRETVWKSDGGVVSEPIFVPRPGNGVSHTEDDGWVLALVYDPASSTSNVTVLDARNLSRGPLARAWFDHHIPPTFHGAFAS